MKRVRVFKTPIVLVVSLLLLVSQSASGQPTFQVWTPDWEFVGSWGPGPDEDTWFLRASAFELHAIGAYHQESSLQECQLLVTVPDGQMGMGTISITGLPSSGTPDPGPGIWHADTSFFPANFNNHYPLNDDDADFFTFSIGSFANNEEDIYDYNADPPGEITLTNATGEVKEYWVEVSGYDWVHFDLYGHVIGSSWWEISPGSHDTTWIPAPGAILLGTIGIGLVGWLRRRRTF